MRFLIAATVMLPVPDRRRSPTRRERSEMLNFCGAEAFPLFRAALKAPSP